MGYYVLLTFGLSHIILIAYTEVCSCNMTKDENVQVVLILLKAL